MKQKMSYPVFILAGIRNKTGRNLATVFCFAFIAVNIFSGQLLMAGAEAGVSRGISRMGADQIVVPAQYLVFLRGSGQNNTMAIVRAEASTYRINTTVMDTVGKVAGVSQMSPQLYVSTLNMPKISSTPVDLFGIDPVTDFTIQPWLRHPLKKPLRRSMKPWQAAPLCSSGCTETRREKIFHAKFDWCACPVNTHKSELQ